MKFHCLAFCRWWRPSLQGIWTVITLLFVGGGGRHSSEKWTVITLLFVGGGGRHSSGIWTVITLLFIGGGAVTPVEYELSLPCFL